MRSYIVDKNGLSHYGLDEISDKLERARVVGRLLNQHLFIYPNPEVSYIHNP